MLRWCRLAGEVYKRVVLGIRLGCLVVRFLVCLYLFAYWVLKIQSSGLFENIV